MYEYSQGRKGNFAMELNQKQLESLKQIFIELNREDLFTNIKLASLVNSPRLKQYCLEGAKFLQSNVPQTDNVVSQMGKAITNHKPAVRFSLQPASDSQPKPFQWSNFGANMVNRLLGKGKA